MSSEILDEVNDFVKIWWDSFQEESSGRLRPAGGVGVSDAHGVSGVDYTGLTAWAKGNSVSTDQHTIHDFVEYFEMLFNRMKEFVVRKDERKGNWHRRSNIQRLHEEGNWLRVVVRESIR